MPVTYLYNICIVLNISGDYILGLSDEMNIRSNNQRTLIH